MIDHISHSQINMWQRCPKQWEYRYVHGIKVPPSGALILGGAYHEAIEVNYRQKIKSTVDLPTADCLDAFSSAWHTRLEGESKITWDDFDPGFIKDQGIGLVRAYIDTTSPLYQPVIVEQSFVKEVAGVKFVVIVDLVDSNDVVVDHKTSSRTYSQDDVDKDIQASAEAFGLGRAIVFQNHIALKAAVPRIQIVRSYRLKEDIDWWYNMAIRIVALMKTGVAPPNSGGWHCSEKFCGYYNLCRRGLARSRF